MNTNIIEIVVIIFAPLIGTMLGASTVFWTNKLWNKKIERIAFSFTTGVMLAVSFLLVVESSADGHSEKSIIIGLILGFLLMFILEWIAPHNHANSKEIKTEINEELGSEQKKEYGKVEDKKTNQVKTDDIKESQRFWKIAFKLLSAVTIHNIPEGISIGAMAAGLLMGNEFISLGSAIAIVIGVAIHNIPECALISISFGRGKVSRKRAFWYSTISGIVEVIFIVGTLYFIKNLNMKIEELPILLSFASGTIAYVTAVELIPRAFIGITEEHEKRNLIIIFILGFALMCGLEMILG